MLGNDVVDLLDPESRPDSFRPRFDARVYTAEERRLIATDPRSLARRWAHWAAKEAAYKLAKQVDDAVIFAPSKLVARFEPVSNLRGRRLERRGQLEWPGTPAFGLQTLELRSFETDARVHVVALPAGSDWGAVDSRVEEIDPERDDPRETVRALAVREIALRLGVAPDRLRIGRRGRIPTVELDGTRTSLSLSLSHHGRWVGYAMTPPIDAAMEAQTDAGWIDSRAGRATAE